MSAVVVVVVVVVVVGVVYPYHSGSLVAKTEDGSSTGKPRFLKSHAGTECFDHCFYLLTLHSDPLKEMSQ